MTAVLQELPAGWDRVEESMYDTALGQAKRAFGDGDRTDLAVDAVKLYFNPAGRYAKASFLDVAPNDPFTIGAADLWAVTTLSMKVPPAAGRTSWILDRCETWCGAAYSDYQ